MNAKWIHCPECDHRMFFLDKGEFRIEIKCSSCKRIIVVDTKRGEMYAKDDVVHHTAYTDIFPYVR